MNPSLNTLDLVLLILAAVCFGISVVESRLRGDHGLGFNLVALGLLLVVLALLL